MERETYLAFVPVAQFVVQLVLFSALKGLAETQPAATDCLWDVADTTLLNELLRDKVIGVALLLEIDDSAVVAVVVCDDALGDGSFATLHPILLGSGVRLSSIGRQVALARDLAGLWVRVLEGGGQHTGVQCTTVAGGCIAERVQVLLGCLRLRLTRRMRGTYAAAHPPRDHHGLGFTSAASSPHESTGQSVLDLSACARRPAEIARPTDWLDQLCAAEEESASKVFHGGSWRPRSR